MRPPSRILLAWLGRRLIGLRGKFGLLLVTGDVMRITSIGAVQSVVPLGWFCWMYRSIMPGCPTGSILAWQTKHFLGAPYPGGDEATVNLAHIVAAVEFVDVAMAEPSRDEAGTFCRRGGSGLKSAYRSARG